jgi:hypothetical protein
MTRPPPLPDLGTLSTAEKDALIVSLWQTINAMEGAATESALAGTAAVAKAAPAAADELSARIGRTGPSRRARGHVPGRRFGIWGLLESRLVVGTLVVIGLGFFADFGIGWIQRRALDARHEAALELENAAFAGLFVELVDVGYEADGRSYRVTLSMQNANPDVPLYIMLDPGRVFVQTGLVWQGVPTQAAPGTSWGVVKLDGAQQLQLLFQADVSGRTELMPGYMHLRIESDMLISRSSEPTDDLVERTNRFNVYLKPQGADDAAIRQRLNFPGRPPIFIPMPPH